MIVSLLTWDRLTFLQPAWLWLAVLVAAALLARVLRGEPAVSLSTAIWWGPSEGAGSPPRTWKTALRFLPRVLTALGMLGLLTALARPVERTVLPRSTPGLDIVLCLDLSSSMRTDDMDRRRTRLEVARDAAIEFIRSRPHDRIGLVGFARYPDVRCPLTLDHRALTKILEDTTTVASDGPEDATGIGTAVARSAQLLSKAAEGSRVVVLLTDGDENVATKAAPGEIAPVHAAQLCERLGVRVYGIVAGSGRTSPSGVSAPLDTRAVEVLARRTGGAFLLAKDARALGEVYARIDALEKTVFQAPEHVDEERFLPFLGAALLLLLVAKVLEASVFQGIP